MRTTAKSPSEDRAAGVKVTGAGEPYRVFTPFWRALQAMGRPDQPLPEPSLHLPAAWPESLPLSELELLPQVPWDTGLAFQPPIRNGDA